MNPVYTADDLDREVAKKELELLEKFEQVLKSYAQIWRRAAEREAAKEKEATYKFEEGLYAGMSIVYNGCAEQLEDEIEGVGRKIMWAQEFLEEVKAVG
jgi:hypothetical protein